VLAPHITCTLKRIGAHPRVLCIEDTSAKPSLQGLGPLNRNTRQGLCLHPTLALTPERLCLGQLNAHRWIRATASLGHKPRIPGPLDEKKSVR
jgi:hypothetical protein